MRLDELEPRLIIETCGFLVGHGANIECKDLYGETALLKAARSNLESNPSWIRGHLQCRADFAAVDFKERGPLHLTLRYSKGPFPTDYWRVFISWDGLKAKLVDLLRAGCPIHSVDERGRTPTDFARGLNLKDVWESALREADKLDDDIRDSLYNEIRQTPCSLHLYKAKCVLGVCSSTAT